MGTVFEWYDFTIYVYLSKVMSDLFFPNNDQRVSFLLYFTVFILSYLIRPLGGILFGYIGDRYGRKKVLFITLLTMTVSTLFMGLIPTYQEIGVLAPLAILILRLAQGLSVGGEGIGATTLIIESCEKGKSFLTSIIWASSGVGILIASLVATSLFLIFDSNQMLTFGWRMILPRKPVHQH
ncbi:major facilitator family transporter [Legionella drozanskii LLAP-1]|uniref:Major facilitator family transporter n=2 Tax=Legionella drozanskii TaxID=96228 RepID=A0A0W0SV37_9GAMM|nr:major facilitator family transporter [Legionella drozanskii LLAP-1]